MLDVPIDVENVFAKFSIATRSKLMSGWPKGRLCCSGSGGLVYGESDCRYHRLAIPISAPANNRLQCVRGHPKAEATSLRGRNTNTKSKMLEAHSGTMKDVVEA